MKLEVGMYVRTKEGYICKILKLNEPFEDDGYLDHNDIRSSSIQEKNVVKASYNIIDLIEVGDYVNGDLITSAEDVYTTDNIYIGREVIVKHSYVIIEEDIETIVTKEQFSAMEYRLGDK